MFNQKIIKDIIQALGFGILCAIGVIVLIITLNTNKKVEKTNIEVHKISDATINELRLKSKILVYDIKHDIAQNVAEGIYKQSKIFGRDPEFVLAIAKVESHLNPEAISYKDAIGLIQVRASWMELLKDSCDLKEINCNLRQGLRILAIYEELFGDLDMALTAYNRGENPIHSAILDKKNPHNGYTQKVLDTYKVIQNL